MSTTVEALSSANNFHPKDTFVNVRYSAVKGCEDNEDVVALHDTFDKGKVPEKEEESKKNELPHVGFFSLFRYSSSWDKTLIIIGTIAAIATGTSSPALMIANGKVIDKLIVYDSYNKNTTNVTMTTEEFLGETAFWCAICAALGCLSVFCNYIMMSFFSLSAANQAFTIKSMFMASILKQDIGWYDMTKTGDFASRITEDLTRIQDGIGEKVGICISHISYTCIAVSTGLVYSWKLSLVVLAIMPVMTIAMSLLSKIQASASREEMLAYGTAGAVAEEVLSSIRTVMSFGGEKKELQRYDSCIEPACKKGIKRGLMTSITISISNVCAFMGYALAIWYGTKLIVGGELTGGGFITVYYNVMFASMVVGTTAPFFEAFSMAKGAAAKIYNIIDRVPLIDSSSKEGKEPRSVKGTLHIRDVYFNYPSRSTVPVLKGVSLDVQQGQTVAMVGPSGCGKSTILQLILRFYDANQGAVILDENNVKDLNVGWLRDNIGHVGQEPVLFSTTIAENIRYGKLNATQEEIENAANTANIHDFIQALPLKYDTLVGERGVQLSGGQKQRIAIARAIIKNPQILLLDEATSALDTESESVVQAALDEASQGRTTVVVAHRLSTIRNADKIFVMSEGIVKEVGTHDELMKKEGIYFNLVRTQDKSSEEENEDTEELDELDKIEEYLISGLGRKMSVLSGNSVGSDGRPPGPKGGNICRRSVSASTGGRRQSSLKSGYDVQESVLSDVLGFQGSINGDLKKDLEEDLDDELAKNAAPSKLRLWKISKNEWPYALVGLIASSLTSLHYFVNGILIGYFLGVLSGDQNKIIEETDVVCLAYVLISLTAGVCSFLQGFMFTVAGERLTSRLRKMVFSNIVVQDVEFFDHPNNSVGSLCSRLTYDASSVQLATGSRISTLLQGTTQLIACFVLAFCFEYKLGLLMLVIIPFIMLGHHFESRMVSCQAASDKLGAEGASKVANEAIDAIRTVASLHQEETFFSKFQSHLLVPHKKSRTQSHIRGIMYGFAQGYLPFAYAAILFYGSRLFAWKEIHYADLLKVLETNMSCSVMIGQVVALSPDYQKAKNAAVRIFKLLDIKPKIDAFSTMGKILEEVNGYIRFQKVNFTYPSRPNVKILDGLNLEIEPGKTVALVGSSGCGKSTCVQLIERFYEPQSGSVFVDDTDVGDMNVSNLRSHMCLVSQEPVLFSYSIAENIAYGDNSRQVDMSEIVEAARKANIHNFISTLPQGYETPVGGKGSQLSGGQKQRVAIARALLRNPKILLLDEATSALDAESEKIVQDALDKSRIGRTCLVIAHRLTTIQNADVILVIHKGKIVEQGTHHELFNKKGHYYNLHIRQSSVH